ncbi:Glyoxalase/Bleomycin resistance protein/Dioxygenase superfamily protein [Pseudorhodobacter antarcticus]|uniref:Glyoxalase/Bleomycin resistance protein/Dioxygenase superfamily protein n=2 Tax=Pseudorhodobacter antarcticus TaxID=1077947 RepID=A0A1H8ADL9_9RHOB|nr:VOC family protein [Pseudorhodobacter antarcticus]SEM68820.1 Glyoxalase/Bleomycin resistance protein/Dioxygenase superfamily protein [Pseudorhodobacter antarcticus]
MIEGLHHIQLAMPFGGEQRARAFYINILGFTEVEKPTALQGRGGVWFAAADVQLHLGVETPFTAAKKAHPAFRVASLDNTILHLQAQGIAHRWDVDLPAICRIYIDDPFGNRIELLEMT